MIGSEDSSYMLKFDGILPSVDRGLVGSQRLSFCPLKWSIFHQKGSNIWATLGGGLNICPIKQMGIP